MHRALRTSGGNKGFTLIEVAIALSVAGLLGIGALYILNKAEQRTALETTHERMEKVLKALATYVDSASRLPCPADPGRNDAVFGWEWGITATPVGGGRPVPATTCGSWEDPVAGTANPPPTIGIVPFLTLGLEDKDVRDGWGRYFTYAVSPVFAQNNDEVLPAGQARADTETGLVHVRCLDESWYDNRGGRQNDIMNGPKGKFCCARNGTAGNIAPNTDIIIQHRSSAGVVTVLWPNNADATPYNNVRDTDLYFPIKNTARDGAFLPAWSVSQNIAELEPTPAKRIETPPNPNNPDAPRDHAALERNSISAVAFVLISHGDNGLGAFLGNGTRNRLVGGAFGGGEQENGAGAGGVTFDRTFVTGPRNLAAGANYFDDIVLWRTQDGIVAETGASSCRYP